MNQCIVCLALNLLRSRYFSTQHVGQCCFEIHHIHALLVDGRVLRRFAFHLIGWLLRIDPIQRILTENDLFEIVIVEVFDRLPLVNVGPNGVVQSIAIANTVARKRLFMSRVSRDPCADLVFAGSERRSYV
jgi:hypothetical protein